MSSSVDDIFDLIGGLGWQQVKYVVYLTVIHMYFPMHMIIYTFVGRKIDFQCKVS